MINAEHITIGKNVNISKSSRIYSENAVIEDNVTIGDNTIIKSDNVFIGKNTKIGNNNDFLTPTSFSIGANSIILDNSIVVCRTFEAGDYLFMMNQIEVKMGGVKSRNSHIKMGKYVMLCDKVMLNSSDSITIGHNVGIGNEVNIWTHGVYVSILRGFPSDFGPVTIGNNVWIPARIQILSNVNIGNNVVIALNSIVNKSLPDGCLAGGIPAKVIKENLYPKETWNEDQINDIISEYKYQMEWKLPEIDFDLKIIKPYFLELSIKNGSSVMSTNTDTYLFDLLNFKIIGDNIENGLVQDFRDYLRRRGIKIYDGTPFKGLVAHEFKKYEEIEQKIVPLIVE